MEYSELRAAQARFIPKINDILIERKQLYTIRDNFSRYYTIQRIRNMTIDEYVLGKKKPNGDYTFCYTLEQELDGLGRILGTPASRFGVYYGKTVSDETVKYRHTKRFGNTPKKAFNNVKDDIIALIEAGKEENLDAIIKNKISPTFKGKLLNVYFPGRYLNIFSDDHLNYFLVQLNLDTNSLILKNAVIKRETLLLLKNNDEIMKDWSLDIFMRFLYDEYPGPPPKKGDNSNRKMEQFLIPRFPAVYFPEIIDLVILPPKNNSSQKTKIKKRKKSTNPNYEQEARQNKILGNRGEKIILEIEAEFLSKNKRSDLAKKVIKVKNDSEGYDINSFEIDGTPKQIEVKATRRKIGKADFFISSNELAKAIVLPNYYLYIVFDILSDHPKIWPIKNPFNPENKNIIKNPVSYRVQINIEE